MITSVKSALKQVLNSAGIPQVFIDQEDGSRIKGTKFAWIFTFDPERVERDGSTIVVQNDRFYLREYELKAKIGVRIAAREETDVEELRRLFLLALTSSDCLDTAGFVIEMYVVSAELINDKSVLQTGAGYDIIIDCISGIYHEVSAAVVDPWLAAIVAWTGQLLGDPWRVYPFWPVGAPNLTTCWKIIGTSTEEKGRAMYEVRKKLAAHIFGKEDQRAWAAMKIVEGLQHAVKIPLSTADKMYLTTYRPEANLRTNPITSSQVTVTLYRNTTRPTIEAPLIGSIQVGRTTGGTQ